MQPLPRILITDDDVSVRKVMKKWFEYRGFSVDEAENGRIAVEKCFGERYDVVMMDNNMPVMSGEEAIRAIKKVNPTLPIVVYSGDAHTPERYAEGQAFSLLRKPMSMAVVETEVRRALAESDNDARQRSRLDLFRPAGGSFLRRGAGGLACPEGPVEASQQDTAQRADTQ